MSQAAASEVRQWMVSARSRGELLTSAARRNGVELVMVGVPPGHSAEEVETWLGDLIGMAVETSSGESGDRPIPALLHHLLTGLLFSHSELWARKDIPSPASYAFVRTGNEVSFGWVGGPAPDLWLDDHPAQVEWVRIRDNSGLEAGALAIDLRHRVRVHFGIGPGPAASVDAAWVPEAQSAEAAPAGLPAEAAGLERPPSTIARAVGARASATPPAVLDAASTPAVPPLARSSAPAGDSWTVVYEGAAGEPPPVERSGPWWSNVVNWMSGGRDRSRTRRRGGLEPAPELPEQIPPSPEPEELTARAMPVATDEAQPAEMREIQLTPLAPEDPSGTAAPPAPVPSAELQLESARLEPAPLRRAAAAAPAAPAETSPPAPPSPPSAPPPAHAPQAAAPPAVAAPRAVAAPPAVAAPAPVKVAPAPESDPPFIEPNFGPPVAEGGRARVARRPSWADPAATPERPLWSRPWLWAAVVALLFVFGWMLGGTGGEDAPADRNPLARALRVVGLGGARFQATIQSEPPGAWITVDGKDMARRTPTTLDLAPGTRQVTLSFADLGSAQFEMRGVRGEKVTLSAPLSGSLEIYSAGDGIPVAVSVDGEARGIAPVTIETLAPGTHEVRFSGPGLQPWGQTVQVRVRERAQLTARAVTSPATGMLEVRSRWTDAEGSEELTGATVYVDGDRRGVTPLSMEMPRGPHSVRIESRGEQSPVQVIDLPGGNQRFANFELGLGLEHPTLTVLETPIRVPLDRPTVISAALQGMNAGEAREMWLHMRQPDGAWRRSPMMMMKAPGGIVGTAVFPNTLLDSKGETAFYISATNQTGDEFFSELLTASEAPSPSRR